jgi:glycosyltransferase involved in cell wall biosynthesis
MKVALILSNFNHAAFIAQAFEGVLSQTYKNWQLWVVDDASTDDSWAVIERYRDRDSRIVAERFPRNRGVLAAHRHLLQLCSGDLLCVIAADDYISNPRYFELAVAALQRFPQAAAAYAPAAIVDAKDGRQYGFMGSYSRPRSAKGVVKCTEGETSMQFVPPQEALKGFVSHRMFITGCSVMVRRALIGELDFCDDTLGPQSDYFFFHALAALHGVVFIDSPVAAGRVSATTYSGSASDDDFFRRYALVEKKFRALPLPYRTDERLWAQFRSSTIASRTVEFHQRRLFETLRQYLESVPPAELQMFPPQPAAFVASLQEDCARLETALDGSIEKARRIFDEVAGPIAPLPLAPQTNPRPWLKPIAEAFLTLGKVVGNALTKVGNRLWEA